jgi:hypothetical protein
MFPAASLRVALVAPALITLFFLTGCGSATSSVEGTITFDGAPVESGGISLIAEGVDGLKAGAEIIGGNYTISAERGPKPGKHRVEIVWNKKTGKQVPTPGDPAVKTDETKQVIPKKYNSQSILSVDIKAGANKHDFALTK